MLKYLFVESEGYAIKDVVVEMAVAAIVFPAAAIALIVAYGYSL